MPAKRKEATAKATNIHFLHGSDEAQLKEASMALVRRLSPASAGGFWHRDD